MTDLTAPAGPPALLDQPPLAPMELPTGDDLAMQPGHRLLPHR